MASIIDEYDRLASDFAHWQPSPQFQMIFQRTVRQAVQNLAPRPVRFLDAGCGHGTWLTEVLSFADANRVPVQGYAVELSESRLAIARERLSGRTDIEFFLDDLRAISLPIKLDLIYCLEVFQCMSDSEHEEILKTWTNLLAPGGIAIIIDKDRWSKHSIKVEIQKISGRLGRRFWGRTRLFSENFAPLFKKTRYPSFSFLSKIGRRYGLTPIERTREREFTALTLAKPPLNP